MSAVSEMVLAKAVTAGVLDGISVLLRAYEPQGGTLPLPPEFLPWLQRYRQTIAQAEIASDRVFERSTCLTPVPLHLVDLLTTREILRNEALAAVFMLDALDRSSAEDSTRRAHECIESLGLFLRSLKRTLHYVLDEESIGRVH